ncbi:hypothetical protein T03_1391 [Trichinella britovi]|uniref:Secreted protein n=1 Tax=Trichinella britovi TaxID=45882 RepID=A0A0V1CNE7_TRIBR|nr:hypothetical protein T03_1391 [Trichinella britovi]
MALLTQNLTSLLLFVIPFSRSITAHINNGVKSCQVSKTLHYNSGTLMNKSMITFLKNICFAINFLTCLSEVATN